jgi:hypothetical protein
MGRRRLEDGTGDAFQSELRVKLSREPEIRRSELAERARTTHPRTRKDAWAWIAPEEPKRRRKGSKGGPRAQKCGFLANLNHARARFWFAHFLFNPELSDSVSYHRKRSSSPDIPQIPQKHSVDYLCPPPYQRYPE